MKSLEDNLDEFGRLNCVPVGITRTPLLCDFWPHGAVAERYGLFREENGFSERANVIVDEQQKVAFVKVYPVHWCRTSKRSCGSCRGPRKRKGIRYPFPLFTTRPCSRAGAATARAILFSTRLRR